jgi:predicted nucleic acid-binding protein
MAAMLLDTNVLSELMRQRPEPAVAGFFSRRNDFLVSAIVFHELMYGIELLADGLRKAKLMARVEYFRDHFKDRVVTIDERVAELSGILRAGARRKGFVLEPMDSLIAASAIARSATLATRNTRVFAWLGIPLVDPWRA